MIGDLDIVSTLVNSLLAAGKKVIFVMHGYGGTLGSSVPETLSFDYRAARGWRGGVIHLLYMCAYILPGDLSMVEFGLWDKSTKPEVVPGTPQQYFFGDVCREEVDRCLPLLVPIPEPVFRTRLTQTAWKDIPCTYLFTRNNCAILPAIQRRMAEPVERGGRQYTEKTYDAGHSVYLSHTRDMVEEVQAISGVFWEQPLKQSRIGGALSSKGR